MSVYLHQTFRQAMILVITVDGGQASSYKSLYRGTCEPPHTHWYSLFPMFHKEQAPQPCLLHMASDPFAQPIPGVQKPLFSTTVASAKRHERSSEDVSITHSWLP